MADPQRDLDATPPAPAPTPWVRTVIAGALMGTANLVPGVSGGTMVLACGLYAHFVAATADVTRGRIWSRSAAFVAVLFAAKFAAMGALGTPVSELVVAERTLAYALFLGMTLAGTPVLWPVFDRYARRSRVGAGACLTGGIVVMAALALLTPDKQDIDPAEAYVPAHDVPLDAVAGAAAYSAMVLPGVSGGTIKLALGRYEPTVWAIGQAGEAVVGRANPAGDWVPILLPYVAGALVGLIAVSNALKWLLERHEGPITAVLLGVLWGSVLPIWPYDADTTPLQYGLSVPAALIGFAAVYALTRWKAGREAD